MRGFRATGRLVPTRKGVFGQRCLSCPVIIESLINEQVACRGWPVSGETCMHVHDMSV